MNSARSLSAVAVLIALLMSPCLAAETTITLPRKKFKLHAVRASFRVPSMSSARTILRANQNPGIITFDDIVFGPAFLPPLSLDETRFSWTGNVGILPAGPAQISPVFALPGTGQVTLSVLDKNSNSQKTFTVTTRVRHVGPEGENDICPSSDPDVDVDCGYAAIDAALAHFWSRTTAVGEALGFGPVSCTADDGRCNAVKHAYWNLLMVRDTDLAFAGRLATAHERFSGGLLPFSFGDTGLNAGSAHNAAVMDLDNNAVGRFIGDGMRPFLTSSPSDDATGQALILNAFNNGQLTRLDTSAISPSNSNPNGSGLLEPANTGLAELPNAQ